MSILNSIPSIANNISIGGSALSLVGMGAALFRSDSLKPGIEGFLFDIKMTENVTLNAQITDHYAEDNTYIQDHVALSPPTVTLVGKIGELVYSQAEAFTFLRAMADRLTPLTVLSPSQGLQIQKAVAAAEQVNSAINSITTNLNTLIDGISGESTGNKQQVAFNQLKALWEGRSLISVETPWITYKDMVIESISADQDESTTMETTFTVTMKQMRFVDIATFTGSQIGRVEAQKSAVKNKGKQTGKTVNRATSMGKMVTDWLGL